MTLRIIQNLMHTNNQVKNNKVGPLRVLLTIRCSIKRYGSDSLVGAVLRNIGENTKICNEVKINPIPNVGDKLFWK